MHGGAPEPIGGNGFDVDVTLEQFEAFSPPWARSASSPGAKYAFWRSDDGRAV
jgi:hypothetical protein